MTTIATGNWGLVETSFLGDGLLTALTHSVTSKWINKAAAVLVVYEWLITSDMEIQLIWYNGICPKQKIFTKVLYLVNRYGVVADLILDGFRSYATDAGTCTALFQAWAATTVLGLIISEYILILRVYAVWKMNKTVILFPAMIYIVAMAYSVTHFYFVLRTMKFFTLLPFGGCLFDTRLPSTLRIIFTTTMLICDTVLVALMVYPTIKQYAHSHGRVELIRRVHDEGVIFYVFILLIDYISMAIQEISHDDFLFFPIPTRVLRSILATRTVLHIREYSFREVGIFSTTEAMSNIRFDRWRGEGGLSEVEE